jgi:hypothetical protein
MVCREGARATITEALPNESTPLHSPRRTRGGSMATILWPLLLVFGVLVVVKLYKNRAIAYESTQRFVVTVRVRAQCSEPWRFDQAMVPAVHGISLELILISYAHIMRILGAKA